MVIKCFPKFMFFFDKSTRSNPGVEAIVLFQKEWKLELFPMKLKYLETSQIRNKTKIQKENVFDLLKNSHLNVKLFCKEDSVLFDVNKHCVHLKERRSSLKFQYLACCSFLRGNVKYKLEQELWHSTAKWCKYSNSHK